MSSPLFSLQTKVTKEKHGGPHKQAYDNISHQEMVTTQS